MSSKTISSKQLIGKRIYSEKKQDKKVGKIKNLVFHPKEKRCIGVMVKRPDFLWMFRRKDLFVAFSALHLNQQISFLSEKASTGSSAAKALGFNLDSCIYWIGLPLLDLEGNRYGYIKEVLIDAQTGKLVELSLHESAMSDVLLGTREIPVRYVKGFKAGIGDALKSSEDSSEEQQKGAILVSSEIKNITCSGGVAEKAGETYYGKVKPKTKKVTQRTKDITEKGVFHAGKQIGKTQGMFSSFKEEYNRARKEN